MPGKIKNAIICECGEELRLKREHIPFWQGKYYYKPKSADCPKCDIHYEFSPTGHLYYNYGPKLRWEGYGCAEDNGGLERVVHLFKNLWGKDRWEYILYCPRLTGAQLKK